MMKLQEYLDNNKKTVADLARAINVPHCVALRLANGVRRP